MRSVLLAASAFLLIAASPQPDARGADQIVECSGEKLAICCWTVNSTVRPSGEIRTSRMSFRRMMSAGVIGPPASAPLASG